MNVEFPETPQANPEGNDDDGQDSVSETESVSNLSENAPTPLSADDGSYAQEVTTFRDAQNTDHIVKNLEKLKGRLEDNSDS